jgi:[DsrC]-trisulfide reductase subunit O
MMNRRDFLTVAGGVALASGASAYAVRLLSASDVAPDVKGSASSDKRWGMVIDLTKCNKCNEKKDCTACLDACREENNVAHYGDSRWDIHWIRKVDVETTDGSDTPPKKVLLLCNHCDEPPCAQVCPVQATYKRADGIVIVDHHRCIGCRYCMIACPYNARFFNFKENHEWPNEDRPRRAHGVAEACTLCAHRLDAGEEPACVEACRKDGADAITVGNLNDPESDVSKLIAEGPVKRLRPDLGTEPKVYYLGL